jgi:hypothetical protein
MNDLFRLRAYWNGAPGDATDEKVRAVLGERQHDSGCGFGVRDVALTVEWADAQDLAQRLRDVGCVTSIEKFERGGPKTPYVPKLVPLPGSKPPPEELH